MKQPLDKSQAPTREVMRLWLILSIAAWTLPLFVFTGMPGSLLLGVGAPFVIWMLATSRLEGGWRKLPILSLSLVGFVIVAIVLYAILIIVNLNNMVEEKHGSNPTRIASGVRITG